MCVDVMLSSAHSTPLLDVCACRCYPLLVLERPRPSRATSCALAILIRALPDACLA